MSRIDQRRRLPSGRTALRFVAMVAVVLVGSSASGCANIDDGSAVFAGDSIVALGENSLREHFGGRMAVTIDGEVGATVEDYLDTAAELAEQRPSIIALNVGTNDVLLGVSPEESEAALVEMLSYFDASTCVVVASVNEHMVNSSGDLTAWTAIEFNRAVRSLVDSRSCGAVAEWSMAVDAALRSEAPGPALVAPDSIHPTPAGLKLLSEEVERAFVECDVLEAVTVPQTDRSTLWADRSQR